MTMPEPVIPGVAEPVITIVPPVVEPVPVVVEPTSGGKTFTADDIERIRKEEKDKLYSQLEEQKKSLGALQAAESKRQSDEEKAQKAAAAAQQKAEEAELSAKELIDRRNSEWEQRFAEMQKQQDVERTMWEKEKSFAALREYTQGRVQQAVASNQIAPELADFVSGNTQQEIDSSIEFVASKSNEIAANVQSATEQARAGLRGVSPTGYATTGPMDIQPGQEQFSVEDLKNMNMQEWGKNRTKLLAAASANQRGLLG